MREPECRRRNAGAGKTGSRRKPERWEKYGRAETLRVKRIRPGGIFLRQRPDEDFPGVVAAQGNDGAPHQIGPHSPAALFQDAGDDLPGGEGGLAIQTTYAFVAGSILLNGMTMDIPRRITVSLLEYADGAGKMTAVPAMGG